MTPDHEGDKRYSSPLFNNSLMKGIEVLTAFGPQNPDMNLPEIAAATGLSRSAAQRFAHTLETLGYLRKDPRSKRYSLTPKTVEIGYRYLLVNPLIDRANPFLLELNRTSGETVNLSEPDGTDMVYIARFATNLHASVHMPVGRRLPMYCTASGRAYLSLLAPKYVRTLLESAPRVRVTPTTITDIEELMDTIAMARENGYAHSDAEYYRGDLNIAVPITDAHGSPIAAVNISAPTARWTMERLREELVPLLLSTGRQISSEQPPLADAEPFRKGYGIMPAYP
ncbi:IclR family transcriptional regulator [Yanghanlia caeni]|uniref:IclR family transcriptional regulator n=1 Tax=Yanghanlia caeni TaxID=3064283 RepID=A0ABU1D8U1_9BURK|nr:IclR family transcriptional regulator [Alcaligenaceae bacterium LG-2]